MREVSTQSSGSESSRRTASGQGVCLAQGVHALAGRGAWIAATSTLVIADVHVGKPESMAAQGVPMPADMLQPTLARITACVRELGAERVVVVGDLLHARAGITPLLVDEVAAWRRDTIGDVEVVLVPGNHDRSHARVASRWNLRVVESVYREANIVYVHDPADAREIAIGPGDVALCGHLHPVMRVGGVQGGLRVVCFVVDTLASGGTIVTLPAFTTLSTGAAIRHRSGRRLIAALDGELFVCPELPSR
jgi:uncharacterized protein